MSTTGDRDLGCLTFVKDARAPDLCAVCQKVKDEHPEGQGQAARAARRRRSEPATNSVVTGVRISALASKFQEPQTSTPPDYGGPAGAVSKLRKSAKGPAPLRQKLGSVGDAPADTSSPVLSPSQSSSSSSSSSTRRPSNGARAISSSSSSSSSNPGGAAPIAPKPQHGQSVITPHPTTTTTAPHCDSKPSPITTKPTTLVRQSSAATIGKSLPKSSHPVTSASSTSSGRKIPKIPLETSSAVVRNSQLAHNEKKANFCGRKSRSSLTSVPAQDVDSPAKSTRDSGILKSREGKAKVKSNISNRRVSIPDVAPLVIGEDGGLDNLASLDDGLAPESLGESQELYLSLTDEEKQLALLALANTLWNADVKNLQLDNEVSKRICREFEDLQVESLWLGDRFQALADCDAVQGQTKGQPKDFSTFPQINKTKPSTAPHVKLGDLFQNPSEESNNPLKLKNNRSVMKTVRLSDSDQDSSSSMAKAREGGVHTKTTPGIPGVERLKSSATSGSCSLTSLNSDGDGKEKYGSSCGSADSGVEMSAGDSNPSSKDRSCKVSEVSDSLYETLPGEEDDEDDLESFRPQLDLSLTESTMEGFQAIALLNDVLKDYTDLNESSTDDPPDSTVNIDKPHQKTDCSKSDSHDARKDSKAKKSSDFEARMASVAAHLDLSKQQTRAKKQAPRPPVSPPPEPTASTAATTTTTAPQNVVSPKKVSQQPDPVFKMVPVGKPILAVSPSSDVPAASSQAPAGLEEFSPNPDGLDQAKGTSGDPKGKKGISSFFKNILRRGKDSQDSFEVVNSEVQLSAKPEKLDSTSSLEEEGDTTDGNGSRKGSQSGAKFSPQPKFMVMPPVLSPLPRRSSEATSGTDATEVLSGEQTPATAPQSPAPVDSGPQSPLPSGSPGTQRKIRGGLASPKMILKKASAKFSPPVSRHKTATSAPADKDKETDPVSASSKPYPAPKPAVPPPAKPSLSSTSSPKLPQQSATTTTTSSSTSSSTNKPLPSPSPSAKMSSQPGPTSSPSSQAGKEPSVRRRAKSPKRAMPPVPPVPPVARTNSTGAKDRGAAEFTKELERRLSKASSTEAATLPRGEGRRSMPVPPPSPPREREGRRSGTSPPPSPGASPPSSPTSPCDYTPEWSGGSSSTLDDDQLRMAKSNERIELPTSTNPGRKGFLGKLGQATRKSRAPQPPAPTSKGSKFVVESATLPRGEKKGKKINPADISGPVMVTDMTSSKVLQSRRNTISLGDESQLPTGVSEEREGPPKEAWDEFLCPVLSPLGSLENLYEAILPKPNDAGFHYYDPPANKKPLCPNIPADGYLEPITPLSLADTATSQALISSVTSTASSTTSGTAVTTGSSAPPSLSSSVDSPTGSRVSVRRSKSLSAAHTKMTTQEEMGHSTLSVASGGSQEEEMLDMSEERRLLLASQPIYEEIPAALDLERPEDDEARREEIEEGKRAEREKRRSNLGLMSQSMHGGLTTSPSHKASTLSSSMLPPPPPPPDGLSNWNSLPRPRPAPRRRPKRPESSEQYVSMNKPNAQVSLNEAKLRDTLSQVTSTVFTALQECHATWDQKLSSAPKLDLPTTGLRWTDLRLQQPPLHTSTRCVLYRGECREKSCQVLLCHRRPLVGTSHPSLLQPSVVFEDHIPVSQLSAEFVQTSPHIHSTATVPCHVALGYFQIAESLSSYLSHLEQETPSPQAYFRMVLMTAVQLLSAGSHCLDQGLSQSTDLESLFVVSRPDLQGAPLVAFLPSGSTAGGQQEVTMNSVVEALTSQADQYLQTQQAAGKAKKPLLALGGSEKADDPAGKAISSHPREALAKLQSLMTNKPGQEGRVRAAAEFLIWGPEPPSPPPGGQGLTPPPLSPAPLTPPALSPSLAGSEEELYSWLEKERTLTLARLAVEGLGSNASLDQLYKLKFLLKSNAASLSESLRRLVT